MSKNDKNFKTLADYAEDIYKCSKCGMCQSVCPVYKATGLETAVSRGKFTLLNGVITGKLKLNKKISQALELCLGCKACFDYCPSGISAEEIISAARNASIKVNGIGFLKKFILTNFKSNFRLTTLKTGLNIFKALGGLYLTEKISCLFKNKWMFLDLFNSQLRENVKYKKLNAVKPLSSLKIVYFSGCINNYINSSIKNSVLIVLEKNGYSVETPQKFSCCGIAAKSAGDFQGFSEMAEKNIALIPDDVDFIITDCASCGSAWEMYPDFVGEKYKEKALKFAAKSVNINKFLDMQGIYLPANSNINKTVTYHDPCHLKRFQNVSEEPRNLIKSLQNINYKEMKDADVCCGAAGTFCVVQPEISQKISEEKAKNIIETKADIVCTSCAGCKIGLSQGLIGQNSKIEVYHTIELLAKAYLEELNK